MGLLRRFFDRLRSDGLFLTLYVTIKYVTGINIVNVYNAFLFREFKIITSCDISTRLPRSTVLPHPVGIVIGHDVEIGRNVRIQQNVTLGRERPDDDVGYPSLANDVRIGAGAVVLGDIHVGEGSTVGANSVVVDDVQSKTTVVGAPASVKGD